MSSENICPHAIEALVQAENDAQVLSLNSTGRTKTAIVACPNPDCPVLLFSEALNGNQITRGVQTGYPCRVMEARRKR